jgi:4-oxalocrotonate tautomerase
MGSSETPDDPGIGAVDAGSRGTTAVSPKSPGRSDAHLKEAIMPIINVKISATRSAAMTKAVSELLLEHTSRILRKKPELTAITIDYVDPDDWIVGGRSLREQGKSSFYFDIKVVDETNTKTEKAQYIREVFAAFEKLLGSLHEESYVYIQDVRPTAYGFSGRTQEARFHE